MDSKSFSRSSYSILGKPWPRLISLPEDIGVDEVKKLRLWKSCNTTNEKLINNKFTRPPEIVIKILAYSRPESLSRLLNSLKNTEYDGENVGLDIYIDDLKHSKVLNQRDTDDQRKRRKRVVKMVDDFVWKHGRKRVHLRVWNIGLAGSCKRNNSNGCQFFYRARNMVSKK